jgi:hypothetical protein
MPSSTRRRRDAASPRQPAPALMPNTLCVSAPALARNGLCPQPDRAPHGRRRGAARRRAARPALGPRAIDARKASASAEGAPASPPGGLAIAARAPSRRKAASGPNDERGHLARDEPCSMKAFTSDCTVANSAPSRRRLTGCSTARPASVRSRSGAQRRVRPEHRCPRRHGGRCMIRCWSVIRRPLRALSRLHRGSATSPSALASYARRPGSSVVDRLHAGAGADEGRAHGHASWRRARSRRRVVDPPGDGGGRGVVAQGGGELFLELRALEIRVVRPMPRTMPASARPRPLTLPPWWSLQRPGASCLASIRLAAALERAALVERRPWRGRCRHPRSAASAAAARSRLHPGWRDGAGGGRSARFGEATPRRRV